MYPFYINYFKENSFFFYTKDILITFYPTTIEGASVTRKIMFDQHAIVTSQLKGENPEFNHKPYSFSNKRGTLHKGWQNHSNQILLKSDIYKRIKLNFVDLYLDILNPHKTQKSSIVEEAKVKTIVTSKNIYQKWIWYLKKLDDYACIWTIK